MSPHDQGIAIASATEKPSDSEAALAGVLDELLEIGAISPEAQSQVMEVLKDAKPEHYPLVVRQFRAALAYRQQLAEREALEGEASTDEALVEASDGLPETAPLERRAQRAPLPETLATKALATQLASSALGAPHSYDLRAVETTGFAGDALTQAALTRIAMGAEASQAARKHDASKFARDASPVYATPTELPPPPVEAAALRHPTQRPSQDETLAPWPTDGDASRGWLASMDDAIDALSEEVGPTPRSTDELHAHMRLRALNMLAGRDDEAYRPIPGAATGPQEFWSKQLFAMATYLDDASNVDDKQRAAATLVHLDEARDKLAELATLQLRNAAFVKNVEGYGVYEPLVEARFRPSERVTIYAEVENFRSESTADGYRTRLATSYQILDESGRRIDGGQFPEIVDLCHNRRRDFHMQLAVPLPERIYPGKYQLELVITDQLSNKIGQQKIPLEIVE